MVVTLEAAKRGVTVGDNKVSGLMFADAFVGIPETPKSYGNELRRRHTTLGNRG